MQVHTYTCTYKDIHIPGHRHIHVIIHFWQEISLYRLKSRTQNSFLLSGIMAISSYALHYAMGTSTYLKYGRVTGLLDTLMTGD